MKPMRRGWAELGVFTATAVVLGSLWLVLAAGLTVVTGVLTFLASGLSLPSFTTPVLMAIWLLATGRLFYWALSRVGDWFIPRRRRGECEGDRVENSGTE